MVTREELKELETAVPRFEWIEDAEAEKLSPIKRPVAKIIEASFEFSPYQVYQAIWALESGIEKRNESNRADENKIKLYKLELEILEKALGVESMESEYKNEVLAEEAVAQITK